MKLFDVYPLYDIVPVKGQGSWLWDKEGKKYLDLYGGHAVISIGHSHPHYIQKLEQQLRSIAFYSNAVKMPLQEDLATLLGKHSGYEDYSLFLSNSGAEANENALKMASFVNGRKKLVVMEKSFHGRTSLAVAATDNPSIVAPINRKDDVVFIPLNDRQALKEVMDDSVCAIIIEGIQGVGGIHIPEEAYMREVRELCDTFGIMLILDEVQSGYGRSGRFFAHQSYAIRPDIITVAKGMGNGFPVAGTLFGPHIQAKHGRLGTTFGGNYLACAAAMAVLEVIGEEKLIENASIQGTYLMSELRKIEGLVEVRGMGLMMGVSLPVPSAGIREALLNDYHIFTGSSSDPNTLRILPALNVQQNEIDLFLNAFKEVWQKGIQE
ncbi:MAG: aspartate aminotransferase family protein [Bacteroidia bacterium]